HIDPKGQPTHVKYPDGKTNDFSYDKDGNPTQIKDQDGNTWKKHGDSWDRTDKNGKNIGHLDGQTTVTKDGDIIGVGRDGVYKRKNHDGSVEQLNDDKSITTTDHKGQVTNVQYPDGKTNEVGYDAEGKTAQIRTNDGSVWIKQGDHWDHYDKN